MPDNKQFGNKIVSVIKEKFISIFRTPRHNFLVFLFFLGLSIMAWFIRALSDTYDAQIKYPVRYTNLPPNRILSQPPPEKLLLTVRSDGYTILSTKLIFKPPLSYNVNAFSMYSLSMDSTSVYTLTRYAREKLSFELNKKKRNIEIIDITPDTLFFNFSMVRKRKIPVRPDIHNDYTLFAQQHMLNGEIRAIPDSIVVTGPSSVIDTLRWVATKPLHLKEHPKLIYPVNRVKVMVPVDEFTESEFAVPVKQLHVPDSIILKTFPKTVKVKYITTLSNFDKVTAAAFKPYVNFNDIDLEMSSVITIRLDSIPGYIHNVHLIPRSAEFLIEKKHVENRDNRRDR
jgi:hypothetical protein